MFYRIAEITLDSQIDLPSFAAFACEAADAQATLRLTEDQPPREKGIVSGDIVSHSLPDGWFFHDLGNDRDGLFASSDYTRLRVTGSDASAVLMCAERFVRLALECLLARRGYVSLHAAAVELSGAAYAFCGPSGVGKSTRARAWTEGLGAAFVSGDRPLLDAGGKELYGVPWDGKEQCFRNVRLPLKAVCEVRRSNACYVRKMSFAQRRRLLLRQCFLPMWDTDTACIQMNNVFRLASRAEILRVFCGPSKEDAARVWDSIENQVYLEEETEMKAKPGFVLRNVMDEHLLMPTGDNIGAFKGAVLLNDVSAFLWEKLQSPVSRDDLLTAILQEYEVDESTAAADLDKLLHILNEYGLLENE